MLRHVSNNSSYGKLTEQSRFSGAHSRTISSTSPKPQPLEKVYIRFKDLSGVGEMERAFQKRSRRIFQKQNLVPYNINFLKESIKNSIAKSSYKKWKSPITNQKQHSEFTKDDRLISVNKSPQNEQIQLTGELRKVNLASRKRLSGVGQCLNIDAQHQTSSPKLLKHKKQSKTGLQKLTQQYHQLSKQSKLSHSKLAIIPIQSPAFLSHLKNHNHEYQKDSILQRFKKSNKHYLKSMRKDSSQLTSKIFQSLCNYQSFDIYSFIRYHIIFVSQQSNNTQKAYFLSNIFFKKDESSIEYSQLKRMLSLFWNSKKMDKENCNKSTSAILKVILEGNEETQKIILRSHVFRKLESYENISTVLISLLYL